MKTKRCLSMLLALAVALTLLPAFTLPAQAAETNVTVYIYNFTTDNPGGVEYVRGTSPYPYGYVLIKESGTYKISDTVSFICPLRVAAGVTAHITLDKVHIRATEINVFEDSTAFLIEPGATVYLTLLRDNILESGTVGCTEGNRVFRYGCAGLGVPEGATLVITEESTGSLTVSETANVPHHFAFFAMGQHRARWRRKQPFTASRQRAEAERVGGKVLRFDRAL